MHQQTDYNNNLHLMHSMSSSLTLADTAAKAK